MRQDATHYAILCTDDSENPSVFDLKIDDKGNIEYWSQVGAKWDEFNPFTWSLCGEVQYLDIKKIFRVNKNS